MTMPGRKSSVMSKLMEITLRLHMVKIDHSEVLLQITKVEERDLREEYNALSLKKLLNGESLEGHEFNGYRITVRGTP